MGFLIFIFIIGLILSIVFAIHEEEGIVFGIGILMTIIASACYLIVAVIGGLCFDATKVYKTEEIPIVALKDTNRANGNFFIGSGHVDTDLYYYYFTETEDGGKQFEKVDAEEALIYDTEKENPHILIESMHHSSGLINFFFVTERQRYSFYIPEGSIDYSFTIDLE